MHWRPLDFALGSTSFVAYIAMSYFIGAGQIWVATTISVICIISLFLYALMHRRRRVPKILLAFMVIFGCGGTLGSQLSNLP